MITYAHHSYNMRFSWFTGHLLFSCATMHKQGLNYIATFFRSCMLVKYVCLTVYSFSYLFPLLELCPDFANKNSIMWAYLTFWNSVSKKQFFLYFKFSIFNNNYRLFSTCTFVLCFMKTLWLYSQNLPRIRLKKLNLLMRTFSRRWWFHLRVWQQHYFGVSTSLTQTSWHLTV